MSSAQYPLGHDPDEIARLELQSRLLEDPLLAELARASRRVLEIGCGVGSNWPLIRAANPSLSYLGIDASPTALHEAERRHAWSGASFRMMDASQLDLPTGAFDLVFSKLVLWSIGRAWPQAIREAHRVLSPGGIFYAFEPWNRQIAFEPARPQVEKLIREWDNEARRRGRDPSIGPRLPEALLHAGFRDVRAKAFPVVALAHEAERFTAVRDNLRQFLLGESRDNPACALDPELRRKAREEFAGSGEGAVVMDFLFVCWGRKSG